jgi:hypothetical protein
LSKKEPQDAEVWDSEDARMPDAEIGYFLAKLRLDVCSAALHSFDRQRHNGARATADNSQEMKSPRHVRFAALVAVCVLSVSPLSAGATSIPPLVKNLAAWYDASNSATITLASSPLVTTWNDLSGNGETLTQSTSGDEPTYLSNSGINGMGSVQFNGSSDFMLSSDTNFSRLLLPTSTVFIVEDPTSTNCIAPVYSGPSSSGSIWYAVLGCGTTADYDMGNSNPAQNRLNATTTATGAHLWTADGTESGATTFNKDGTTIASGTASTTVTSFSCALVVGAWNNCTTGSGGYLTGTIGEIVIYNTALSQTNYQIVEGYLACKWGLQGNLPSGHPYKSTCPSGTPTTFSPSISGLAAWYDASNSASITLASTTTASSWSDLSGNGETLTQTTSADRPTWTTSCTNSLSCLTFNGSSDYFLSSDTNFSRFLLPSSTVFIVQNSSSNTQSSLSLSSDSSNNVIRYEISAPYSSTVKLDQGDGSGDQITVSTGSASTTGTHLWTAKGTEGGALLIDRDGTSVATGTASTTGETITCAVTVGANTDCGSTPLYEFNGTINEIVVYNTVLAQAEYQYVEGYLACKWGLQSNLPSGHPYKSTCPSGTPAFTVSSAVSPTGAQVPGTVLTYTATYTNGGGIIDYNPVVTIAMPAYNDFQVGSVTTSNLSNNGLSASVTYSSNGGTSYVYTPASGAGGAPSGYDRSVTNIKVTFTGALGCGSTGSTNTGTVVFVSRIQ